MNYSYKNLRCAVIGVGYLGRFHAQKYRQLADARDDVSFVGVCDASGERANEVASELGVKAFSDFKELIGQVDAITVAASTEVHYEVAKVFLENGVHVHVEKPITSTSEQAKELVQIAKDKNLKLQVGHIERFNPALRAARAELKQPLFIECHRLAPFKPRSVGVDVILDLMIHDIDVILSLIDSPIEKISAVGTPVLTKNVDIANARIEFESGATANVTASRVSQGTQRKFRVFQSDQYLSIDFESGEVTLLNKKGEWLPDKNLPIETLSWNLEKSDALFAETESFVDAIQKDIDCEVSGDQGLQALLVAEQVIAEINGKLN